MHYHLSTITITEFLTTTKWLWLLTYGVRQSNPELDAATFPPTNAINRVNDVICDNPRGAARYRYVHISNNHSKYTREFV